MAGLYLHIPFCKQACYYCDFHFSTQLDKRGELVKAIARELELQKTYLQGEAIDTIYFGGGTPSLLTSDELLLLYKTIQDYYVLSTIPEATLEANPDDLTQEKLRALKQANINRLSIGIQSFDDAVLKFLNRSHKAKTSLQSFDEARSAGFQNISIDLIYAIPGQTVSQWRENIEKAIALNPEHISAYTLTIESNTVFGRWQSKGKLTGVPDDRAATQMELLVSTLEEAGYEQYEVSNFCKPGYQSRHNRGYWSQQKYLGVGPSAHSFNMVSRQHNVSNNHHYLRSLSQGLIPFEKEVLARENKINEYLLTSLRTVQGCDINLLYVMFGFDLLSNYRDYINDLLTNNLAILEGGRLKLTRTGLLLADKIATDFFQV